MADTSIQCNTLIVIQNGQLKEYCLDDKPVWTVGRPTPENTPDIKLLSKTVSRKHGTFKASNGIWFYSDEYSTNGTKYNGKKMKLNSFKRKIPVILNDGDVFIFGSPRKDFSDLTWALYSRLAFTDSWQVIYSKGYSALEFSLADEKIMFDKPEIGTHMKNNGGIAIYMGDKTFVTGNIKVSLSN